MNRPAVQHLKGCNPGRLPPRVFPLLIEAVLVISGVQLVLTG